MDTTFSTPAFEAAFTNLNNQQREAVTYINGPVLVLAGPGTGKTKVLAVRIGHILQQTDAGTGAILCLTFSNAGVQSMKENLRELIGPVADEISIHTFHSFANRIIARGNDGSRGAGATLLTEAQSLMIIEKLLSDKSIAGNYLSGKPRSAGYLKSMASLFAQFKKESLDKDHLLELTELAITKCAQDEENYGVRGGLKSEVRKLIAELRKFAELGNLFDAYSEIVTKREKLAFDDLLGKAICQLYTDSNLYASLREQYQYILVDEFQDTNAMQLLLLEMLIKGIDAPNLFIVGDDDQCIYKFQGAAAEHLSELESLLPGIKRIRLESNYRSTQAILDHAHLLISCNADRPVEKQQGLTACALRNNNVRPVAHSFVAEQDEGYFIVNMIKAQIEKGTPPREIAVLFRKRQYASHFIAWLKYWNISFTWNTGKANLLDVPWGKSYYLSLRYLVLKEAGAKEAETYLIHVLMEKYGRERIAILFTQYRYEKKGNQPFSEWLLGNDDPINVDINAWLSKIQPINPNDRISDESIVAFEEWLGLNLMRKMLTQTNLIAEWDKFIKDFCDTNPICSWAVLSRTLNYYQHYQISIPFEKEIADPGIRLSTIHGSKGLEFDYVYVVGCTNQQWESARHAQNKVPIPKPMFQHLNVFSDEEADLRRLFYVAMTRAKIGLVFSCLENEKGRKPSLLLKQAFEEPEKSIQHHPAIEYGDMLRETISVSLSDDLKTAWQRAMEKFELTASSLNAYLSDPEKFIWHSFFKIPDLPAEAMSFGTCIHNTLEDLIKYNSIHPINDDRIRNVWCSYIDSMKPLFDPLHYHQYRSFGYELVLDYFRRAVRIESNTIYRTEEYLHGSMGKVKIAGKMDLICLQDESVEVLDYKTGTSGNTTIKSFVSAEEPGDSFWRQAAIYTALIAQHYPDKKNTGVKFELLEIPNQKLVKSDSIMPEWYHFCEQVWDNISRAHVPRYIDNQFSII